MSQIVQTGITLLQEMNLLGSKHSESGSNIIFSCPFTANHGGRQEQATPSFGIHAETGYWHCFSTSCGQGGRSIHQLYSRLAGVDRDTAERTLGTQENKLASLEQSLGALSNPMREHPYCKTAYPKTVPLADVPEALAYVRGRNIPDVLAARCGLSYFPELWLPAAYGLDEENRGSARGHRVIMPIFWDGVRIGYSGRSIEPNTQVKYYRPVANIGQTVYNPVELTPAKTAEIYVVEGEFSALAALREGLPTVSIWGSVLSLPQAAFLARFKKVRLMLDPDESGLRGMANAMRDFGTFMTARPVFLPTGYDPGDMPVSYGAAVRQAVADMDAGTTDHTLAALEAKLHV